jgi:plastocyanin
MADTMSADAPSSELLAKGESYSFTFKKAGTYTYHCTPHPYMKGTVVVE